MAGGSRPGAGRPRGARNRKTQETVAAIEESGLTPLDFMLKIMRDAEQPLSLRADAAKNAAPYVHPRLAAVEHSGKVALPIVISSTDADL